MGEYPSASELRKIRTFDGTLREFVEFLRGLWWEPVWGFDGVRPITKKDVRFYPILIGEDEEVLYLSTAGWSGNEDIIRELEKTSFWALYWFSSRVGGHYVFLIDHDALDKSYFKFVEKWRKKKVVS